MVTDAASTFEQALQELQAAVEALEQGGLPLDDAVALYERAMRLVAVCGHHLDQIELRVVEIEAAVPTVAGDEASPGNGFEFD